MTKRKPLTKNQKSVRKIKQKAQGGFILAVYHVVLRWLPTETGEHARNEYKKYKDERNYSG